MAVYDDLERDLLKAQIKALFSNSEAVEEAIAKSRTESELMAKDILAGKKVTRAMTRQKTAQRRKPHWKTSKKKARDHYLMHIAPKNAERRAALLKEGDSWKIITEYWHRKGVPFSVEEADWREFVAPVVDGMVFFVNRYDKEKDMSLENLIVRQTKTGDVLFDGADYKMKKLGYCL